MSVTVERRNGHLYVRGRIGNREIRLATGTESVDEATAMARRLSESGGSTFSDACDAYIDRGSEIGQTDGLYLDRLRKLIGTVPLALITRKLIDERITKQRLADGLKPASVRRELATLQAILNWAVEMELVTSVPKVRKPRGDARREEWLNEAEVERFISLCPEDFRPFASLLFYTGMRLGEATKARWDHVVGGTVVQVRSRKGKGSVEKVRSVPLHPAVLRVIGAPGTGYLAPRRDGTAWSRNAIYDRWQQGREKMGRPLLTPHCARHSFASNLLLNGVDSRTVAELLGHSSMEMMKRYTHLTTEHLTSAVLRLGA